MTAPTPQDPPSAPEPPQSTPPAQDPLLSMFTSEERRISGICLGVALVALLLPWYSVKAMNVSASLKALDAWQGVLAFLCALAVPALFFGVKRDMLHLKGDLGARIPMFLCAGGALFILLFILRGSGGSAPEMGFEAGPTLWVWLSLLAMATGTFFAYQNWDAARKR